APAPLGEIGVGVAQVGAHGGAVDGLLAPLGELALGALPALLDDDLGRDVAPVDDGELGHQALARSLPRRRSGARRRASARLRRDGALATAMPSPCGCRAAATASARCAAKLPRPVKRYS